MRALQIYLSLVVTVAVQLASAQTLTLESAVQEAMKSSTQTKIFDEKLVKSREFEHQQRGSLYPNVSLYANAGRGNQMMGGVAYQLQNPTGTDTMYHLKTTPYMVDTVSNMYSYGVQVSGPLYTFGKVSTAIDMAKLQDEAMRSQVIRSKQELQLQVIDAYIASVIATAKVEVLKRSRDRAKETWTMLDRDFKAGSGQKSDVLMAYSSLKALEPQIITAERDADAARRSLNNLIGRDAADTTTLDTTAAFASLERDALPSRTSALDLAYHSRQDLQALLVSAEVNQGISHVYETNYYPTIVYQGKLGMSAYTLSELNDWTYRTWQIGVGLTWTIFDGLGSNAANKAQAEQWKSDSRVFKFQADELHKSIEIDVDEAMKDRVAADTSLQAAQDGSAAAAEALSLVRANYPSGSVRLTDVLSAEDGVRNAELGVLSARFNRTRAMAKLRQVQGIDLVPQETL